MFGKLRLAVGVTILSLSVHATDLSNSIAGSVSDGTASLPYRLFQPRGTTPGESLPLVLFLHGAGDRGTDNVGQTYWASQLVDHTQSGPYAAYVLAPQINTNMWFSSNSSQPTEAMSLTMQAVKHVMETQNIDPSRVYVTGVSMGSFGTWDILRRDPGVFAAAVPMSGGGDPSTAAAIKHVPIWAFHGSADGIVPVDTTRNMIAALRAVGGDPNYTEVAGGDHFIWPAIYSDANKTLYPWLFSQRLGLGTGIASAAPEPQMIMGTGFSSAVPVPEPTCLGCLVLVGVAMIRRSRKGT